MRALWILLCVGLAFLVLQTVQLWGAKSIDFDSWRDSFSFRYSDFGLLVLYLIITAIIVRLIHEDPPVGTSGFWLTRPISRKSLLLAKSLFSLLFLVIVPVAADFILLFHFGMNSSQILPFLFATLAIHLAIICVCASLAVLTPNLTAFFAAAVVAVVCQAALNNYLPIVNQQYGWMTTYRICALLYLVLSIGAVVHQYLTRKTVRSWTLLIAGIPLAWLSCHYSLWDTLLPSSFNSKEGESAAHSIKIVTRMETNTIVPPFNAPFFQQNRSIVGALDLLNIPVDQVIVLRNLTSHIHFQDGRELLYDNRAWATYGSADALRALLPEFEWTVLNQQRSFIQFLWVSQREYKDLGNQAGTYTGEAQFEVYRNAIISEVPLIKGAQADSGSGPITIVNFELYREAGSPLAVILERSSLTAGQPSGNELSFCLLNRPQRQAFQLDSTAGMGDFNTSLILPGVNLTRRSWIFYLVPPDSGGRQSFMPDDAWLKDARLAVVKRNYVGQFSKKFEIKNFRMADYTLERLQERARTGNREEP